MTNAVHHAPPATTTTTDELSTTSPGGDGLSPDGDARGVRLSVLDLAGVGVGASVGDALACELPDCLASSDQTIWHRQLVTQAADTPR